MRAVVNPGTLHGVVEAIPSKSDVHRLLICAALADGPLKVELSRTSDDMDTTIECLRCLGASIERVGDTLQVNPIAEVPDSVTLDCHESGSTLRFLLPVATALCGDVRFTGSGRLPQRPIADLVDAMSANGVMFRSRTLPVQTSGTLRAGVYSITGDVSSQYLTGLLLALPRLQGDSVVRLTTPLESSSYVKVTRAALAQFGVRVRQDAGSFLVHGNQTYHSPGTVRPAGDWSNAAFFLAAGALGDPVTVRHLQPNSPQGDRKLVDLLERFGATVERGDDHVTVSRGRLRGCTVDMSDMPDLLPILSVVATAASGETHLAHAARLRLKESDRLSATASMIRSLGGRVRELPDGLIISGSKLTAGTVSSFGDHRMVMSAAVAATVCGGTVQIEGAQAVNKSYPSFFRDFASLGGEVDVI